MRVMVKFNFFFRPLRPVNVTFPFISSRPTEDHRLQSWVCFWEIWSVSKRVFWRVLNLSDQGLSFVFSSILKLSPCNLFDSFIWHAYRKKWYSMSFADMLSIVASWSNSHSIQELAWILWILSWFLGKMQNCPVGCTLLSVRYVIRAQIIFSCNLLQIWSFAESWKSRKDHGRNMFSFVYKVLFGLTIVIHGNYIRILYNVFTFV